MQAGDRISAHGINTTVTFKAGLGAQDIINVTFDIDDDEITMEAPEVFEVKLSLPQQDPNVVQMGDINTTIVKVVDDDGMYLYKGYE